MNRFLWVVLVTIIAHGTACSSPAGQVAPAHAPSEPAPLAAADEAPPSAPVVLERDGDFDIIWKRPDPPKIDGECNTRQDMLFATRVGLNRDSLAVDLKVDEAMPGDPQARWRGGSMTPRVQLLVDGCPAKAPAVQGQLRYGGPDGRVVLARRELPQGDLTLVFEAFDKQDTLLFVNDASGLRTATSEEHKRWVERPANPQTGEEAVVEYWEPNCPEGSAP
jgi:hypothetical protein